MPKGGKGPKKTASKTAFTPYIQSSMTISRAKPKRCRCSVARIYRHAAASGRWNREHPCSHERPSRGCWFLPICHRLDEAAKLRHRTGQRLLTKATRESLLSRVLPSFLEILPESPTEKTFHCDSLGREEGRRALQAECHSLALSNQVLNPPRVDIRRRKFTNVYPSRGGVSKILPARSAEFLLLSLIFFVARARKQPKELNGRSAGAASSLSASLRPLGGAHPNARA
jgi:hypothetical protein